ncbi:hypothetical protein [Streptomyces sp. NPDC056255]|uniref:hypothetical protein n=1 Tax=Streptomyces sp. NPDC056255 TaxID=3345764 RepID=UPI0035E012A7
MECSEEIRPACPPIYSQSSPSTLQAADSGSRAERASGLLLLGEEEGWAEAALIADDAPTAAERQLIAVGQLDVGHMALIS